MAAYFGIAKKKTLNEVSYGGQEVVNYWRFNRRQRRCIVYCAVSDFLSRCYGCVPQEDMAVVRSKVLFRRTATSAHATPKLQTLPPTETTLLPNILRAHYQTALWMSCENQDLPQASPTDFGWYRGEQGQMLPEMYSRGREPNIAPKSCSS